jgi:hypothetical protein
MKIGIVGLPNVGKSTLFNALSKSKLADAKNYPFCTIDPNISKIEVPDYRLDFLSKNVKPQKTIPAVTEFVDIAGLVKGASQGEGLGNQFLANIRECNALIILTRVFVNKNISHVHESIDPQRDLEIIETELILADLESVNKSLEKLQKDLKKRDPKIIAKYNLYQKIKENLEKGIKANQIDYNDEEKMILKETFLLTLKPFLYVLNVDEDEIIKTNETEWKKKLGLKNSDLLVKVSAELEAELAEMSEEDQKMFLEDLGITDSGGDILIKTAYSLLGLKTFFTAGEKEVRAWTFKKGFKTPECAGVIHTDFEKKFICAEILKFNDFEKSLSWQKARDLGLVKTQGKDYEVQDGDICIFKNNA